ncbi:MAG: hypothetical protein EPGJADBJ_00915 [Saprospiraceae bacterium]|nr:hypothetical protein [Saprospiraceae bacterium]
MKYQPATFASYLLFMLPFLAAGQNPSDTSPGPQSRLLRFAETGATDADRATLHVFIRDQETDEPVLGATVLLQRQNPDQVHGKISQWDGRCKFKVAPGTYILRVQLTGMITFEKQNIELSGGREFSLDLDLARLGQPVPSAKQQAGKN